MERLRPIHNAVALLLLLFPFPGSLAARSQAESTQPVESPAFSRLIQPTGWAIPSLGKRLRSGLFARQGVAAQITYTEFAADATHRMFLPRYYREGDGLVLLSLRFYFEKITRLEVNGKAFAFLVSARGADAGIAADAWWLDREGNGRFTEFQWNPDVTRLPKWVIEAGLGR